MQSLHHLVDPDDEVTALVVNQNYLRANSRTGPFETYDVKEILRERVTKWKGGDNDLVEVLVFWEDLSTTWEPLALLNQTTAYKTFCKEKKTIRNETIACSTTSSSSSSIVTDVNVSRKRKREDGEGEYVVEKVLAEDDGYVMVLWKNWDDPTWEPDYNLNGCEALQIYRSKPQKSK